VEVVASFSQGRTAAAQCGLFTHKSVPVIFEPPCSCYSREIRDSLFSGILQIRPLEERICYSNHMRHSSWGCVSQVECLLLLLFCDPLPLR